MGSERLVLRQNADGGTMMSFPNADANTFIGVDAEQDATYAYTQRLDYGSPDPDDKAETSGHNCRCIRKD